MIWWLWLLGAWVAVAVPVAVWGALALRNAEIRDWHRRGLPDRRSVQRVPGDDHPVHPDPSTTRRRFATSGRTTRREGR